MNRRLPLLALLAALLVSLVPFTGAGYAARQDAAPAKPIKALQPIAVTGVWVSQAIANSNGGNNGNSNNGNSNGNGNNLAGNIGLFKGTFTPQKFAVDQNGALALTGTLSGTATDTTGKTVKQVSNQQVDLPVSFSGNSSTSSTSGANNGNNGNNGNQAISPKSVPAAMVETARGAAATCSILHLVLGPLDLNLLGLQITLNQVNLNINAIPGAGNLLGNLLCDVANLLNSNNGPLSTLLNDLLSALNGL